jgi:hypothetical protein
MVKLSGSCGALPRLRGRGEQRELARHGLIAVWAQYGFGRRFPPPRATRQRLCLAINSGHDGLASEAALHEVTFGVQRSHRSGARAGHQPMVQRLR